MNTTSRPLLLLLLHISVAYMVYLAYMAYVAYLVGVADEPLRRKHG